MTSRNNGAKSHLHMDFEEGVAPDEDGCNSYCGEGRNAPQRAASGQPSEKGGRTCPDDNAPSETVRICPVFCRSRTKADIIKSRASPEILFEPSSLNPKVLLSPPYCAKTALLLNCLHKSPSYRPPS